MWKKPKQNQKTHENGKQMKAKQNKGNCIMP